MTNLKTPLNDLKRVAKVLNLPLSKLLMKKTAKPNIVFINNNVEHNNISKQIDTSEITMESKIEGNSMKSIIRVPDNYIMEEPWYFCFSLDKNGTKQAVAPEWHIWKNAKVKIFAYCFGLDENVIHWDWKTYYLDEGSSLEVYEFNFNSDDSYMTVYNTFTAHVGKNAYFKNHYESTMGHLGHWITKWKVFLNWENAKADFITKNKILTQDISDLDIKFYLKWKNSSWVMISKSVTFEGWTNIFKWTIIWEWDDTSGHIECSEISMGQCEITTIPSLQVKNPSSRLTHEAAVWTLEQKSIENLMIKGFSEEEAIKFMINWILE